MAPTEAMVQLPADSTGKKLRTNEVVTTAGTVEQQVVTVGDGTTAANLLEVAANGSLSARLRDTAGNAITSTGAGAKTGLDVTIASDPDTTGSGTITAVDVAVGAPAGTGALLSGASTLNSYVTVACPGGDSAWNLQLTGTFGGTTVYFEESLDSTTGVDGSWVAVNGRQTGVVNTVLANGVTTAGVFRGNTSGAKYFRARAVGGAAPNIAVVVRMSSGVGAIFLNAGLPSGLDNIGSIRVTDGAGAAITSSLSGAKQLLDVNLAGSGSSMPQTAGSLTAAVANTPGVAVTASSTAQVVANVANAGNVTFHLVATAFVGTVIFETSVDAGLNYGPVMSIREDGTGSENGLGLSIAAAFIRQYTAAMAGMAYFRVRCSAWTSGALAVVIAPGPMLIEPNPSLAASTAAIGAVTPLDSPKPTFTASHGTLAANFVGDIFVVHGSATKTVRITRVDIGVTGGGTITSAGDPIALIKRTGSYAGGTSGAAGWVGSNDSADATVTATANIYTAAATTQPGQQAFPATVRWQQSVSSAFWSLTFGDRPSKAIVLRGVNEHLAINNGVAAAGTTPTLTWAITVEWTEE